MKHLISKIFPSHGENVEKERGDTVKPERFAPCQRVIADTGLFATSDWERLYLHSIRHRMGL